ncbi:MAG TPA: ABC transporter permease [Candidatus Limnocylindria bacterium]|jgi:spermidine/putrescine transport system permease protein|nr:ABC transporter permease [Candidatus Limnocylindria bacterium]
MFGGRRLAPYLLLLPGAIWLLVFFAVPMAMMLIMSLQQGSLSEGFHLTWNWGIYPQVATQYSNLFVRSVTFALTATVLTLAIGYPMAYFIAFYGGRLKNALLLVVIMPFFVSFVIRTLNWRMILSDNGLLFGTFKDIGWLDQSFRFLATPASVIFGLTYNFLPFMVLPLYVALEKIDRRLIEAATDLYANRSRAFLRVTFPLSLPGVVAGSLLTFIPAVGDFINADIIGARSPEVAMVGNVIQRLFLNVNDFPSAAALGFVLVAATMLFVGIYTYAVGSDRLTS